MSSPQEASIRGLSSCSSGTRFFASNSGITPLGMAALVGDRVLADLFLKMGAYDIPNQRGLRSPYGAGNTGLFSVPKACVECC